jgi:hypothetical protein
MESVACAVESVIFQLPQSLSMEFRWKIRSMIEKSKFSRPSMTTKELKTVKSLRLDKDIRILQADKGNCTLVLDESKYKDKPNTLLDSGIYQPLPKDPTAKVERKVQKLLSKHKTTVAKAAARVADFLFLHGLLNGAISECKKVKLSLYQAMEAHRVVRR